MGRRRKAEGGRQWQTASPGPTLPTAYCLLPTAHCLLPSGFYASGSDAVAGAPFLSAA
jgi:hypothetical protein